MMWYLLYLVIVLLAYPQIREANAESKELSEDHLTKLIDNDPTHLDTQVKRSVSEGFYKQMKKTRYDANDFSRSLSDIVDDDLSFPKIQENFDNMVQEEIEVDAEKLVNSLKDDIGGKFAKIQESLISLKEVIEKSLPNFNSNSTMKECCHSTGGKQDPRFRNRVNFNEACISFPIGYSNKDSRPPEAVLKQMKKNKESFPDIHRQFFGMEDVRAVIYPAQKSGCNGFGARFRPWYIEAVSSKPKDIVFALDVSYSMYSTTLGDSTLLQIAENAVRIVMKTLSANDRVGFIKFAQTVHKPHKCADTSSCFKNQLAVGTKRNLNCLQKFNMEGIPTTLKPGKTNYNLAIKEAFKYFHAEKPDSRQSRSKIILFVSDGEEAVNKDSLNITNTIAEENHKLNNSVTILTFGIGDPIDSSWSALLQAMADQTATNPSKGPINRGEYFKIKDTFGLRTKLANYYNDFSNTSHSSRTIVSAPYYDYFFSGPMITASVPFFDAEHTLAGVVGIDIPLEETLMNITYFCHSRMSYAFMIDSTGRTIGHPMLAWPTYKSQMVIVPIEALERKLAARNVIQKMIDGEDGSIETMKDFSISNGDSLNFGVDAESFKVRYHWRRVKTVDGQHMTICVVIPVKYQKYIKMKDLPSKSFTYAHLDLLDRGSLCSLYNKPATTETSVVHFSHIAFQNKIKLANQKISVVDIRNWTKYMTNDSDIRNPFKSTIRPIVTATSIVDDIWLNYGIKQQTKFIWRHVSSVNGVFRVFPGLNLSQQFDHTTRPWFIKAVNHPEKLIIMAPYTDFGSGHKVITIAKAIHEGRMERKPESSRKTAKSGEGAVVAIVGGDFRIQDFFKMVKDSFSICQEDKYSCFVVDTSGFIVSSEEIAKNITCGTAKADVENIHIVDAEPAIAQELIKLNNHYLVRKKCFNIELIRTQFYWRLLTDDVPIDFPSFSIYPIRNTNILLVVKDKSKIKKEANCWCDKSLSKNPRCRSLLSNECECPCYFREAFNYCSNELPLTSDLGPICTKTFHVQATPQIPVTKTNLVKCFDRKCSSLQTKRDCMANKGCNWCHQPMVNSSEGRKYECTAHQCLPSCHPHVKSNTKKKSYIFLLSVVIASSLIPLLICLGIFLSMRHFKLKKKQRKRIDGIENNAFISDGMQIDGHFRNLENTESEHDYQSIASRPITYIDCTALPRPPNTVPTHTFWKNFNRIQSFDSIINQPSLSETSDSTLSTFPILPFAHLAKPIPPTDELESSLACYADQPRKHSAINRRSSGTESRDHPPYMTIIPDEHWNQPSSSVKSVMPATWTRRNSL